MNAIKKLTLITVGAVLLLFAGIAGQAFFQPPAAEDAASDISSLEAGVEKDPDNLHLGSTYRQAIMKTAQYDRGLKFFEKLAQEHENAANAHLNFGFEYVDKIPVAGSITQVLLANNALTQFTKAIELKPSWIGYYTRGNSYLFWPKIFGRTPLGIADLEEAIKLQKADKKRIYHVRAYIALGDGYWKMDELDKAKATWAEGLAQFPNNAALKTRLSKQGDDLKPIMDDAYDVTKRVDTSLQELWADQ